MTMAMSRATAEHLVAGVGGSSSIPIPATATPARRESVPLLGSLVGEDVPVVGEATAAGMALFLLRRTGDRWLLIERADQSVSLTCAVELALALARAHGVGDTELRALHLRPLPAFPAATPLAHAMAIVLEEVSAGVLVVHDDGTLRAVGLRELVDAWQCTDTTTTR